MAKRTYPLELILRAHGPAELVNANEETLWASDSDADFKDEISDEFLKEEDFADILEYLLDAEIITQKEFTFFETETWDCSVESLDQEDVDNMADPGDDDDGDEENDEG